MKRRTLLLGAAVSVASSICAPAILRARSLSDNEIIFCLDWSDSMYTRNGEHGYRPVEPYVVQRDGHAAAFRDPQISELFVEKKPHVYVVLWASNVDKIKIIFSGQVVTTADVEALAHTVMSGVPNTYSPYSLTKHEVPLIAVARLQQQGIRRIVDISTDQAPDTIDEQRRVRNARDALIWDGMTTVNVFSIDRFDRNTVALKENVQSPDGFTDRVEDWSEYGPGMKKKIERELLMF